MDDWTHQQQQDEQQLQEQLGAVLRASLVRKLSEEEGMALARGCGVASDFSRILENNRATHEVWRTIPGFPHYEASSFGRIRTLRHEVVIYRGGKVLKPRLTEGRGQVSVPNGDGTFRKEYISRLVLAAFSGICPPSFHASHLNGDCGDNRADNLAWESPRDNNARKVEHGTQRRGDKIIGSKLTESQVIEIRQRYAGGDVSQTKLGALYGVSPGTIHKIVNWKAWRHVKEIRL